MTNECSTTYLHFPDSIVHVPYFYCCLTWPTNELKWGDLINHFNPSTLLCLSQAMTWIPYLLVLFIQWFEVRCGCSHCWYRCNCSPSPFVFVLCLVSIVQVFLDCPFLILVFCNVYFLTPGKSLTWNLEILLH
jgi:hypothetical protein